MHERELRKRPRHQGRIYAEWQALHAPLTVWIEAVYRGRHFDDEANRLLLEDAVYLNAQASYRVTQNMLFYVRGENLNQDRTPETFSFGAPGASVFGGIRLEWFGARVKTSGQGERLPFGPGLQFLLLAYVSELPVLDDVPVREFSCADDINVGKR